MRLVIFDVDGTLVDSQAEITGAMSAAFTALGWEVPPRAEVLSVVGLSLPKAIGALRRDAEPDQLDRAVEAYKDAYVDLRAAHGAQGAPLYPGARMALDRLVKRHDLLLGVATGKSRRGLAALFEAHDLGRYFVTTQTADDHPSKPHPAMLMACLRETDVAGSHAAMVGDTSFDMEMARAAGLWAVGVDWGYHPRARLGQAHVVISSFDDLEAALDIELGPTP